MTTYAPDFMRGQFGQMPDIGRGIGQGGMGMGAGMDYAGILQRLLGGNMGGFGGGWSSMGTMGGMGGMMPWQGGGLPAGMGMFGMLPDMGRAYSDATTPQQTAPAAPGNPMIGPGGPARPIY